MHLIYNLQTFREFCLVYFYIFVENYRDNNFLPTSKHWQPKFVTFLVFVCTTASCIAQISSFENVSKLQHTILALVAKQWIAKNILSDWSQPKHAEIAIRWFGKY